MTLCNVLVAAAEARVLPGSAASCGASRSLLGRGRPRRRPPGCEPLGRRPPHRACAQRTMSAGPPPPPLLPLLLLALLAAPAVLARRAESAWASQSEADHQPPPSPGNATQLGSGMAGGGGSNSSVDAVVTRISSLLRDLPTLKATVIVACAFSALLIACLLLRVFRLGKRLKKTRKYDIITTPAERVEMAPLNEEDDEDEDSTVFDIKYR
ncbi:membrane protein FAM174B isoform X2 [Arvicanthis niloticus]|uniref:membrane protein FAM174B isoform X2 n=1 Tax=Arvicanthis niloticus TaxID=61156 RepID=UPI001487277A|nr:membrane protein FAM174B [Arvicanthis niloticus]